MSDRWLDLADSLAGAPWKQDVRVPHIESYLPFALSWKRYCCDPYTIATASKSPENREMCLLNAVNGVLTATLVMTVWNFC